MEDQAIKTLTPSFGLGSFRVISQFLYIVPVWAVADRYHNGHWGNIGHYTWEFFPLMMLYAMFIYLAFVPRRIQWSSTECRIQLKLDGVQILPWTQLSAYGDGNNVFYLKFTGVRRFQIFAGAFPRDDWQALITFLKSNFPVKKTSWLVRAIWGSRVAQQNGPTIKY